MTYPTLSVEVAFVDAPTATSWTWVDITAYVKKITTRVGRDRELDDFEPGRATIVLDNTDRRFDPEHATGPYYGNLLPSKRVRIRATHKAVTYTLFHGFVDDWPQDYSGAWESEVVVPCTDAFGQLARVTLPTSVYAAEVMADTPWGWWRMQEAVGRTWADSSGNRNDMGLWYGPDASADYFQESPVVDASSVSIGTVFGSSFPNSKIDAGFGLDGSFSAEFWTRTESATDFDRVQIAVLSASGSVSVTLGDGVNAGNRRRLWFEDGFGNTAYTNANVINDGRWHHVIVRMSDVGVITVYVDGASQAVTTTGSFSPPSRARWAIEADGFKVVDGVSLNRTTAQVAEVAVYPGVLSGTRCLAHYTNATAPWNNDLVGARINRIYAAAGWPSGLRSTATGLTRLGPAHLDSQNALAYLRSTANAEQGQLFCDMANEGKVTFLDRHERLTAARSTDAQYVFSDEDDPDSIHYERIDLKRDGRDVINSVTVKWTGGEATSTDAASIATYGLKSHTVSTELGSRIEAENMGEWIIGRYGRPVARCRSLELNPAAYFPAFTAALDTRINDRATIRKQPGSVGDPIELDAIVEGIEHHIDAGVNVWTTRLRLSQADAGPWWIPDVGVPDISTRPAW